MSTEGRDGKKLSREEKDRLVEEARASMQTQKEWCAERGIRLRTLRHWVCDKNRREKKAEPTAESVTWLEINAISQKREGQAFGPSPLEVHIGVYEVRVFPNFDRTLFADVCRTLSELC